jgi:hypothetical protein
MNIKRIAAVIGLAQAAWLSGCGNAEGGGGGGGDCGKVMPCGGDIVGEWTFKSVCTDTTMMGDLTGGLCPSAAIDVKSEISGSVTYDASMTYSQDMTISGTADVTVPASCLMQGGFTLTCELAQIALNSELAETGIFESGTCKSAGSGCSCTLVMSPQTSNQSGDYTTAGTQVTHTPSGGVAAVENYCVQGRTLHIVNLNPSDDTKILSDRVATR